MDSDSESLDDFFVSDDSFIDEIECTKNSQH